MTRDNKKNTAIYTAFDDYDGSEIPVPEKGLLRAILLNAIADLNREDEHARKARSYFLSKEDDYIFSFQAVCSYLNINPHHIMVLVGLEEPIRPLDSQRSGHPQAVVPDGNKASETNGRSDA